MASLGRRPRTRTLLLFQLRGWPRGARARSSCRSSGSPSARRARRARAAGLAECCSRSNCVRYGRGPRRACARRAARRWSARASSSTLQRAELGPVVEQQRSRAAVCTSPPTAARRASSAAVEPATRSPRSPGRAPPAPPGSCTSASSGSGSNLAERPPLTGWGGSGAARARRTRLRTPSIATGCVRARRAGPPSGRRGPR